MSQRLFPFLQAELPFELGPPDGRRVLRNEPSGDAEWVIVLETVGGRRAAAPRRRGAAVSRRRVPPQPEPESVPVTRATTIDPDAFDTEHRAQAWLAALAPEQEVQRAFAALNRLLYDHRIAAADAYACDVSPHQALVLRVGFGEGEQVAYGRWLQARELTLPPRGARRRGWGVSPTDPIGGRREERLSALLTGRERALLCEELALRARSDLDTGRIAHAAIELDRAYAAAAVELPGQQGVEMLRRVSELSSLRDDVARQAEAALAETRTVAPPDAEQLRRETVTHALTRLESALRARGI